jgi:imidazoleglycerol-phosphate dehydratase/histidinol-phosphatase
MKRALFIDRDGTLIVEPPEDFQVDSLEKLEFVPGVFRTLHALRTLTDFELVIVSNQDGLGTDAYPRESYEKVQEKIETAFKNEGVVFDAIHIDPSLPQDGSPDRKPGTGMLGEYMSGEYDLKRSFVIGDRLTDIELARNLGARGILFAPAGQAEALEQHDLQDHCALVSNNWDAIYRYLRGQLRTATVERKTGETDVKVTLALDGMGRSEISTGLGFFDHMLEQIARHGQMDLEVRTRGDLHVDEHHTIEDTGLAFGEALLKAIGDKRGIGRYGFVLPMDEALAQVAIDLGGRPWIVWNAEFSREKIGDMPTEMFFHFFKSVSDAAKMNLNISVSGDNEHHKIEGIFKAFARALRQATAVADNSSELPSTKGTL